MCECYSSVKQNISEHFQKQIPEGSKDFELSLEGYVFGITDDGVTHRSANNAVVRYLAPKKGGGMKKVTQKTFVRATFCPFCGVKYE
ncbi:hypothetical protein D3C85_655340 [compost metagenome]